MYDIFYYGENQELEQNVPFARRIETDEDIQPKTKMYWVVESNIEMVDYDVFEFRPEPYDQCYEHVWKWNPENYGGLKLLPKKDAEGIKEINQVVCRKRFDVLRQEDPGDYFDVNPYASHVWCVDPDYKLNDAIDWAPSNFEPNYIHCFHLRGQLEHKYPDKMGGAKLFPRDWREADIKIHGILDAGVRYPVMRVSDPMDYAQRDVYNDDYVWLIDKEYQLDSDEIDWVPNVFEENYIHTFRSLYQLTEKYPNEMGGAQLVPRNWRDCSHKIHKDFPLRDIRYDVFYVDDDDFTDEVYQDLSERSKTDWFWVVDREYEFNADLVYIPHKGELEYIHLFKIPGQLEGRYDPDVEEVWENRASGVKLFPKKYDLTKLKMHKNVPLVYDIFYTENPRDWARFRNRAKTKMFWVVDQEFDVELPAYIPRRDDRRTTLYFKVPGQLAHKYPDTVVNVVDNRVGGVVLAPLQQEHNEKYAGYLGDRKIFQKFSSYEEGVEQSRHEWFWVVEKHVKVDEDFGFMFMPDTWDKGKPHVWQKRNPITEMNYDYGGVWLYPKEITSKRPKYIKEIACSHHEFPQYWLDKDMDFIRQLEYYDGLADNTHYWVVDPDTVVSQDFKFDYYPTQWDSKYVHVFRCSDGEYRNIRLYPKGTFSEGHGYTIDDVSDNSFEDLKEIDVIASLMPEWPKVYLNEMTPEELEGALDDYSQYQYIWTIDPDVSVDMTVIANSIPIKPQHAEKVHIWQRANPHTNTVHSYGGLRLWPTGYDREKITWEAVNVNKIKSPQYVRSVGATYNQYDIVFLSHGEDNAQETMRRLKNVLGVGREVIHVKDVDGIFEAHQAAARKSSSKMFWVVDADAWIVDDFKFDYIPDQYDQDAVHVWGSINPVTGLEYGYGGVKLFNRKQVLEASSWGLDFATGLSKRFKYMPVISCETRFNTSDFAAWRSGFREAVKLTLSSDKDSTSRLDAWLNPNMLADFAEAAARGAEQGHAYALKHKNKPLRLARINDFEWLEAQYESNET